MASPNSSSVILFGDSSQDTSAPFTDLLLSGRDQTHLSQFLSHSLKALQEERLSLPHVERATIPAIEDFQCFQQGRKNGKSLHPALRASELTLLQLGSFISDPNSSYPSPSTTLVLGLCLGELAASAVSSTDNLIDLVPLAVIAVRASFRIGHLASKASNELFGGETHERVWSVLISKESELASVEKLKAIQHDLGIPSRKSAYLSARATRTLTLSGPPSTLDSVLAAVENDSSTRPCDIPVYVPYHAPHLYSREMIDELLGSLPFETCGRSHAQDAPRQYISGCDGKLTNATTIREGMTGAAINILCNLLDFETSLSKCSSLVSKMGIQDWTVLPFGPSSSAPKLTSTIAQNNLNVSLDQDFWRPNNATSSSKTPLAIVGMAGRFPQASDHDRLWNLLMDGRDVHQKIPEDRFDPETHLSSQAYGCFIENPGNFDARFFNMSPREALQTDPGQRLAMETAYEALEMSGFVPNRTPSTQLGRIGTFYGQTVDEYKEQNMPQNVDTYFIPGSLRAFGPGRINRHFKFGGPASSLDTACSSSSVALNTACNSVWDGECDTAVAGGINILSSSDNFVGLSAGQFLSKTGSCKTFDDAADGYCRAEAVVSVVIKRLDAAQADNDNILGVIRSCSTNYSADAVSITRPHGPTQETLYEKVLADAGIRPFDVDYIEMHGTGTQAGDACEMTSVTNVFAPAEPLRPRDNPLYVGAIKSNIGHGEAASGAASLVKALLVLRENTIPPHVGIKGKLNHTFPDLDERNLVIPKEATTLPARSKKRRILVNNFGAAGGNTAMVLEEPDKPSENFLMAPDTRKDHIINVTAKTVASLRDNLANLVGYLDSNPNTSMSDLSYTTTARRMHHHLRTSVVASTVTQLKAALESSMPADNFKAPNKISNVAFAFTGQGSVYCSLGKELFATNTVFQNSIMRLDEISRGFGFSSILPIVDGSISDISTSSAAQTHLAITSIQISLCRLWASLGVKPDTVIGHSLGEYAALYASGVLSASDTVYLVGKRAQILEATCNQGTHAMLAINASVDKLGHLLDGKSLEVACINGPNDTVLSGLVAEINEAHSELKQSGVKCVLLSLPYGFHSSQVEPILNPFKDVARGVNFNKPSIPVMSPLLAKIVTEEGTFDGNYLARHAREAVNFSEAVQLARNEGIIDNDSLWIEIGPHPLCLGMVTASLASRPRSIASLRKTENSGASFAKAVSSAFSFGVDINWSDYHRDFERGQKLLVLPSYSFEEKNFWMAYENDWMLHKTAQTDSKASTPAAKELGPGTTSVQRLLSQNLHGDGKLSMLFESDLSDPDLHAAIIGHLVNGAGLCPASIYADIALTIGKFVAENNEVAVPTAGMDVSDMIITHPIVVTKACPTEPKLLHVKVDGDLHEGILEMSFGHHRPEEKQTDWKANCKLRYGDATKWKQQWSRVAYLIANRITDLERGVSEGKTHKLFQGMVYKLFASCVDYDIKYQAMKEVLLDSEALESTAKLELYQGSEGGDYYCKPFWVDALVHLAGFVMNANDAVDTSRSVFISGGWGNMQFSGEVNPELPYQVHTKMIHQSKSLVAGDVYVFQEGQVVAVISDLKFQQVPHAMLDMILTPSGSKAHTPVPNNTARTPAPKAILESAPMSRKASEMTFTKEHVADKVCSIVAEEVGIPVEEAVEINAFDEMGVDSLLSLQIASILSETLGLEIDSSLFQQLRTIAELQEHLGSQSGDVTPDESDTSSLTEGDSTKVTTPVNVQDERGLILSSTIAQQLGVEEKELHNAQDLQELGLDSLMSLSILAVLRDRLGVNLEPDALIGATTLVAIQKLLGITSEPKPAPSPMAVKFDGPELKLGKPASTLSVVLQGKPNTAERTAFFLPDGSGSAAVYAHLPPIDPDVCVIGLQSPFARCAGDYVCTLEALASIWVDEIQRRQPSGPYILAGYSAGGYYAFEAAKQLQQRGEKVAHLVIVDSPCRAKYEPMPSSLISWLGDKGILGGGDTGSKQHKQIAKHFEATVAAVDRYKPEAMKAADVPPVTVITANEGAVAEKNPTLPDGIKMDNVTEWLLRRSPAHVASDGWESLLPGRKIDCRSVPGHHFNLLSSMHGGAVSRTLAAVI